MEILIPILKIGLSLLVFGVTLGAGLIHVANRQSRSYMIAAGYLGLSAVVMDEILKLGCVHNIKFFALPILLLGLGEIVRFFGIEKKINRLLHKVSKFKGLIWSFKDFYELPINEWVDRPCRKIKKIQQDDKLIIAVINYQSTCELEFESEDSDCIYSVLGGTLVLTVKGETKKYIPGEEYKIKCRETYQISARDNLSVKVIILKRYDNE